MGGENDKGQKIVRINVFFYRRLGRHFSLDSSTEF